MGRQTSKHSQLFYLFNLEQRIPGHHLLRRINPIVTRILAGLRDKLQPFYSENRATFDRSGTHAADAHCRLVLWHSVRAKPSGSSRQTATNCRPRPCGSSRMHTEKSCP